MHYPAIIVGAGPAGLAVSALLTQANIGHLVLEQTARLGGLYSRLHPELSLLSPPYFNELPLLKKQWRTGFTKVAEYRQYLNDYASRYQLPVQLHTAVETIAPAARGYQVRSTDGLAWSCNAVVVATGMSQFPRPLDIDGAARSAVDCHFALDWRGAEYYRGKKVLIVGSGTSAFELTMQLAGRAEVHLATNKPVKAYPIEIAGINVVYLIRPLEKLPRLFAEYLCRGYWQEPAIGFGIEKAIKAGLVKVHRGGFTLRDNQARFGDKTGTEAEIITIDMLINCTGYRYDSSILPASVKRYGNGFVICKNNQSLSHPGLFLIGHPCAHNIDSKFLRGIYHDAYRVAEKIKRRRLTK